MKMHSQNDAEDYHPNAPEEDEHRMPQPDGEALRG
jgi:hypothetical protein